MTTPDPAPAAERRLEHPPPRRSPMARAPRLPVDQRPDPTDLAATREAAAGRTGRRRTKPRA